MRFDIRGRICRGGRCGTYDESVYGRLDQGVEVELGDVVDMMGCAFDKHSSVFGDSIRSGWDGYKEVLCLTGVGVGLV